MPKAEVGSTKYVANKMKAKGLQRLRWYCQICEKQCRDENGFKQHTMSESHVRNMLQVGEDPKKYINEYSNQFKRDFLRLLKTSHGEKKVHMNNFYQEYIRDKEHVHMNSTKWPSLTEFAKFLGREGLCRVEEGERGLEISFIDDSADAVTRREAIKRSEREAKGSEDLESKLLNEQIKRAREAAKEQEKIQAALRKGDEKEKPNLEEVSKEPVKLSFSLGAKAAPKPTEAGKEAKADEPVAIDSFSAHDTAHPPSTGEDKPDTQASAAPSAAPAPAAAPRISLGGLKSRKSNPLMGGGKKTNALAGKKAAPMPEPEKKMSNTERIMREEMEQKRLRDERGGGGKRQRMG